MRECFKISMMVEKRGRGLGLGGLLRGHPWAFRRLELEITYTKSHLQYYNGDALRDDIDLMGSQSCQLQNHSTACEGRINVIKIILQSGESILFSCENEQNLHKILKALENAGNIPTPVDKLAEKLRLNVLMKDHERVVYSYFEFKGTKLPGALEPNFDPAKKGVITLDLLNEWENLIETVFPKLYTKNSDNAQMEEYHRQEFARKIEVHRIEAQSALQHRADDSLVKRSLDDKIFADKVVYVTEKEGRLLEQIKELSTRYN